MPNYGYAPSQMYAHSLDRLKGWFNEAPLDFQATLAATVTFSLPAGRVVHLNAGGEFITGLDETGIGIFLLRGVNNYDVSNPPTDVNGVWSQQPIIPAGILAGLVATGGYELSSTEFDATRTYTPGDLLTAVAADTNAATGGVLTNAGSGTSGEVRQYVDPVCGVVSRGAHAISMESQIQALDFWTAWLPGQYT